MAYLTIVRIQGDADEIFEGTYQEMSKVMTERVAPENGGIAHVAVKTDDGLMIVNLWELKEGSDNAAQDPEVQQIQRESGVSPDEVRFEHYDVANHVILDR